MNHIRSLLTLACLATLAASLASAPRASPTSCAAASGSGRPRCRPRRDRAAAPTAQRSAEYIVALVNSEPITNTEVQHAHVSACCATAAEARSACPAPELARMVLERLINERAQLQLAQGKRHQGRRLAVDQAEQNVARQNQISVAELRRRVARRRHRRRRSSATTCATSSCCTRLREREIEAQASRSRELDIDQFMREQRAGANAASPLELNIAQILVGRCPRTPATPRSRKLQARPRRWLQRARAGEDFAEARAPESPTRRTRASGGAHRHAHRRPLSAAVRRGHAVDCRSAASPARSVRRAASTCSSCSTSRRRACPATPSSRRPHARHILLRPTAKRSDGASGARGWPSSSAGSSRHGRFRAAGARELGGRQRAAGRRPRLGAPGTLRARVRGGDERAAAGRHRPIRWSRASACT